MTNQPLLDFILTEVKQGATKESITKELLGAGWETADIYEGFKAAGFTDAAPVATPTINITQPTYSMPITPDLNIQNTTATPETQPIVSEAKTFSTLDSYANPNPGNNSYNSSPVYAGQVVKSTETTNSGGGKKVLLFIFVLLIVFAGGLVYAVKTNIVNVSFVTNLIQKYITPSANTTNKVAVVTEEKTPVVETRDTTTTVPDITVAPTENVLPNTNFVPPTTNNTVVTPAPVTVSTTPVSVVTSMPDLKALCKDTPCKTYFGVWLTEQMFQNNVAKSYLNAHIVPKSMKISSWVDGQSFEITYDYVVDWAKVRVLDTFMVKTVANDVQYQSLKLRKGIYFSESEVRTAITNGAYNGQFLWFTPATSLMFATKQDAIDAINKVDTTKKFEIATNAELLPVGQKPKVKKELYLSGFDKSTCKSKNQMTVVHLNLFTGATSTEKTTCVIN